MSEAPATPAPVATEAAPTSVTSNDGPAAGPGGQPNATGDAAPSTPDAPRLPPRYSELGQAAKARLEEQQAREQREQDARDAKAWREMMARGGHAAPEPPRQPSSLIKGRRVEIDLDDPDSVRQALGGDPTAYRAWLNGLAKHAINPDAVRLERELRELKGKPPEGLDEIRQTVEQIAAERQAERAQRIQQAFIAGTEAAGEDGSPRFPLLSRLAPEERLQYAQGMIAEYRSKGYDGDLPNDFIMGQVEEWLDGFVGRLRPAPPPAAAAPVVTPSVPSLKRPQGGQPPKRSSQSPRSLTNTMATPQGAEVDIRKLPPEERERAIRERALANLAARRAASG